VTDDVQKDRKTFSRGVSHLGNGIRFNQSVFCTYFI